MQHRPSSESTDIKIFVSCREETYVPQLPFLIPMQVGTALEGRSFPRFQHDDEGESISSAYDRYGDLTAQYWVWKNVSADYYGFMQDKRYVEFDRSDKFADEYGAVSYGMLSDACFDELGYREESMVSLIEDSDIVVGEGYRVPGEGDPSERIRSWYDEDWRKNGADFDRMLSIIRQNYPEYGQDADSYLSKATVLPFGTFVMKGELFEEYAQFLFGCLVPFSEAIDERVAPPFALQAPQYLAEHLLGIFVEHCLRLRPDTHVRRVRFGCFHCIDDPYLEPAFKSGNCPVVFSSSDYYAPFAGVAMQSIVENSSPDRNYDIIVLDTGMRDSTRMQLRRQLQGISNVSLRFLNIEHELKTRNLPSAHHITIGTFGRFLILEHLRGYDKVVYLDCDLVVNADVAELYDTDLGECLVAAVRDTAGNGWYNIPGHEMREHMDNVLCITEPSGYFNAGVLVMNLAELRCVTTCDELMRSAIDPKWMWLDQDVLNHVCRGRVKYLEQSWNYMAHKESYQVPWSLPEVWLPKWLQNEYAEAQLHPKVVHYVGRSIPCFAPEADCYWYFWKYARASLFYERILKIAMSEAVENEQMSTKVHARQAFRGVKEAVKSRFHKRK